MTKIDLGDVQETLLIPLYFRASESKREDALFRDAVATRILPQLDYDFSEFDKAWALRNDVVVRTVIFDELVTDFTRRHPSGRIINLGAGLDARFQRLDNGAIRWFDLDMPDAIALRQQFIQSGDRNCFIAKSMFDESWFDEVGPEAPTLIVAEALLFYFPEDLVRGLFEQLCKRLAGAEMIFQSVSPAITGKTDRVPVLRRTRAELKWGIRGVNDLDAWGLPIECIQDWSLVDRCEQRWRWYTYAKRLPYFGRFLREVMKVNRVRLVGSSDKHAA